MGYKCCKTFNFFDPHGLLHVLHEAGHKERWKGGRRKREEEGGGGKREGEGGGSGINFFCEFILFRANGL
jgi:hypothetical protein